MSEKVLFVDDEPNVLEGIRRQIGRKVEMETATSGADGLKLVQENGPYAVVVSDMRMPVMNGSQFLSRVRELAPDSVRMILSGQSDIQATIDAVNHGQIFRFLTKPCPPDMLWRVVESGLKQYQLITAERDLLEKTLSGAVKVLTEVLGIANPVACSRASRVQKYTQAVAEALGVGNNWQLHLAAMLSQVGCISLPAEVLAKVYSGTALTTEEQKLFDSHPDLGARLIGSIPRLEPVAEIIAGQMHRPDLSGTSQVAGQWDSRTLGLMVLRAATEIDDLITSGLRPPVALQRLTESWPQLPAAVADSIRTVHIAAGETVVRSISLAELAPGMVLDEDLKSRNGIRLVPQGQEVTQTVMVRLRSVAAGVGIREPFRVRMQQ